jgi:hypothetical protein
MGRTRQALKCSGHRTDGQPCQAYAINGGKVCAVYGGRAPQVKAAATRQLAERQAAAILAGIGDYGPVTDPLTELQYLAGRAKRFMEILEGVVAELQRIRYTTQAEQIDGRVILYERSMDRLGKLLADIARLDIDSRLARISEDQARLINAVMLGAMTDAGLSRELQEQIRPAIARRLRLAAGQERQRDRLALPGGAR